MKQLKNQRGLTLIELLAVIVILAIIAAIAAVAIGNVINNTKDKAILSDAVMVIEGAKLANLDGACEDTNGAVTCSSDQLKPFVSGSIEDLEGYTATFTAEGAGVDGGGHWSVKSPRFDKIKNKTKYAVTSPATETELKQALNQDKE